MKKNYWIYIVVIVLLMGGVIAGLVIGINNANNSNDNEQKNSNSHSNKNRTITKPSQSSPSPVSKKRQQQQQEQQEQKQSIQQMFQLLETFTDFEKDSTFGVSLSGDGISQLYVGEPGYQSYGKVKVFRVHDQKYKTLDLVKEVEFTNYGSKFQKAGYKIQGCLVAAPDHESKGAIFRINPNVNHSAQVSIERVDNYHHHSQHSMVKYGDMFQYRPPYLFTVTQSGHNKCQRIEIYHEDQHSLAQVLESPIQSQQEQNLFGYSLQINDVNTRMTVLDPCENTFYVYETIKKNERKQDNNNNQFVALYTLTQTVSLDALYQDKQDLSQQMVMDYAGQRLILVSPENNLITLYISGKQFELQQQWTFPNITLVTMEPSGQYLALYSETNNECTLYHWCSENFLYQLLQKWTIHHVLDMHWQNQHLFVSTPDSLLWFGVESEE